MTRIRSACADDIEEISCVLAKSWKTAYRGIVDDAYLDTLPLDHWVDFLASGLSKGSIIVSVMDNGHQIVGAAIISKTGNAGECCLISFYLLPDKIGQGLGHTFYNEIEAELINCGYSSCVLDVLENNTRAIRFYKAHGFHETGKEQPAILGDKQYTCKVLEKRFIHERQDKSGI